MNNVEILFIHTIAAVEILVAMSVFLLFCTNTNIGKKMLIISAPLLYTINLELMQHIK